MNTITGKDWADAMKRAKSEENLAYKQIKERIMQENLTDITFLIDRSASMMSVAAYTQDGVNKLIQKNKECEGRAVLSIYQFSSGLEDKTVAVPIKEFGAFKDYTPTGGSTKLYDSACRVIDEVGKRLSETPEANRPSKVVFVIVTDGENNVWDGYTLADLGKRIKHQRGKYKWEFVFIGAEIDARREAAKINVNRANSIKWAKNSFGTQSLYNAVADNLCAYRSANKADMSFTSNQVDDQTKAGA